MSPYTCLRIGKGGDYGFKYEFIERLLRQPEKDLTNKTLQEMANLYQDLLDRQLASSSQNLTAKHLNSNH